MREALLNAVKNAIVVEFQLPYQEHGIDKSCLTSEADHCFSAPSSEEVSRIIYNGIVEFAVNEYDIDYDNLEKEQRKAIISRIRYNPDANNAAKLKYGFYGEVLLDLVLRAFMGTNVLAARGYFYSPIEHSEPKGFDAFHIIEHDSDIQLWFGEAKFYQDYAAAITSVLEKLEITLSDSYLKRNLLAIINQRDHITTHSPSVEALMDSWENNPEINLAKEISSHHMKLVYPVFIGYQKNKTDLYHESISKCIEHITNECKHLKISIPASFDYRLFFIFLPLSEVKRIKERVIEWIDSREPLM